MRRGVAIVKGAKLDKYKFTQVQVLATHWANELDEQTRVLRNEPKKKNPFVEAPNHIHQKNKRNLCPNLVFFPMPSSSMAIMQPHPYKNDNCFWIYFTQTNTHPRRSTFMFIKIGNRILLLEYNKYFTVNWSWLWLKWSKNNWWKLGMAFNRIRKYEKHTQLVTIECSECRISCGYFAKIIFIFFIFFSFICICGGFKWILHEAVHSSLNCQ